MSLEDGLESIPVSPKYPTQNSKPYSIFQAGYEDTISHRGSISEGVVTSFKLAIGKSNKHSILLVYRKAVQVGF
jgi:hypothetical protein